MFKNELNTLQKNQKCFIKVILHVIILSLSLIACSDVEKISSAQSQENQAYNNAPEQTVKSRIPGKQITVGEYLHFNNYSVEDGLSQSTVFCALQDNQGYIWFGTEDGLNRFDGYSFSIYKNDPDNKNSISSNWIQSMLLDSSGNLWIGTRDGGLNKYDRNLDQFTQYRYDPEDLSGLSDDEITALYLDQDGFIWVGTANGGLNKFDPVSEVYTHYQQEPGNLDSLSSDSILSIHQTKGGNLWIGTKGGGLSRLDRETDTFTTYRNEVKNEKSIISDIILSIFEDSFGDLWIGTDAGLDKFNRERGTFSHFQSNSSNLYSLTHNTVQTIYEDSSGSLWIGTYGGGLNYFDRESERFLHYHNVPGDPQSISSDIVISIFQDREGILWFGTIGGGVNKLELGRINFTHYKNDPENNNSLSSDMVRGFYQDDDKTIWIGTMFGGLNHFDPKNKNWQHYKSDPNDPSSLSDNFVSVVYRDQTGILWVGTIHGLDRYEPETDTFTHFDVGFENTSESPRTEVTAIYESQNGKFWIGTTDGLYQFDRQEEDWSDKYHFDLSGTQDLYVYIIIEDESGLLWIGTLGEGFYIFNPGTEDFFHYQNNPGNYQSISQNFITALLIDQTGYVWIGTNGTGLDKFNPTTNSFTHYQESDGLPNDSINCLLDDSHGNIWVSTNHGLSKFDPNTGTFTNFDVTDGLQSNEFNAKSCLYSNSGEMIFGGINGFNVFMPENVKSNPVIPPMVITSTSRNNEEIDLTWQGNDFSESVLNWPVDSFEFEYAALSYAQPEKNNYAYYLEGFEETWKEVGNRRFGEYTNLPSGTYTLRVKGSNNDEVWNDIGAAIKITIVPPFWQSGWFYGIVIVAILGLFYGGYRMQVRTLEVRGRELESQVDQRTTELMEIQAELKNREMEKAISEERNRLARDLHDSVTQSIYSLTLLAEAGQRMIKGGNFTQAEDNQTRLGEIAQQALQEMRLLVYELRPQVLETEGLVGALEHRLETVERRAGINARLLVDLEIDLPLSLEEELFHISMEALNNSLKHAKASEVVISLHTDNESLILIIEDNGRGFDQGLVGSHGGMGILSMTERAEKVEGSLSIQSIIHKGTKICLTVPLHVIKTQSTEIPGEDS